jgi:exopolysaccharide production protein ExoZ
MERLHNLDYLRGLAAFGIMIFHYLSWSIGEFDATSFMGRVGLYGVSIFYVLSGLTLFYVYQDKMKPNLGDTLDFFKKRIFRILPLLWVATIISIFVFHGGDVTVKSIFLNLTGLFGFVQWDSSIATGAWSIGNELVFYVFFPVFILFSKKWKIAWLPFVLLIFALYVYFAFFLIDGSLTFDDAQQRSYYFNPFNQLFLFLGGYLIGLIFRNRKIAQKTSIVLIIAGILLFTLYPAQGPRIHLVQGWCRMALTLSCFMICLGFYKVEFKLPALFDKGFKMLGEASYSVYLLHPIVHRLMGFVIAWISAHMFHLPEIIRFGSSVIITLVLSYFVYQYFEKYFIRLGKGNTIKKTA